MIMKKKKLFLSQNERRILLQSISQRCLELFTRLESESNDLNVFDYFDCYYPRISKLIGFMEDDYPDVDMSTNDFELLYKRSQMRKKN